MISLKKIIVLGATGGTGKQVVEQILQTEHYQVTVLIRKPDAFTVRHKNLQIIRGDVFQPQTFENAIKEKNAVVSCLGVQHRKPTTVYSEGVGNIIDSMQKHNVSRIICLSAGAVIVPPKSSFMTKFITKNIFAALI
jgi:putative NADH-flavin reductase